jgi:very-short-patch-repair endonuclease
MKREIILYNPNLKERARELRNNPTPAESRLWQFIKGKRIMGFDFHRQKPLDSYIVDFYCYELPLIIEIDSEIHNHDEQIIKDQIRSEILEDYRLTIIRFTNDEVLNNTTEVLHQLKNWIRNKINSIESI